MTFGQSLEGSERVSHSFIHPFIPRIEHISDAEDTVENKRDFHSGPLVLSITAAHLLCSTQWPEDRIVQKGTGSAALYFFNKDLKCLKLINISLPPQ